MADSIFQGEILIALILTPANKTSQFDLLVTFYKIPLHFISMRAFLQAPKNAEFSSYWMLERTLMYSLGHLLHSLSLLHPFSQ